MGELQTAVRGLSDPDCEIFELTRLHDVVGIQGYEQAALATAGVP
jgi:hypothetical protein